MYLKVPRTNTVTNLAQWQAHSDADCTCTFSLICMNLYLWQKPSYIHEQTLLYIGTSGYLVAFEPASEGRIPDSKYQYSLVYNIISEIYSEICSSSGSERSII